LYDILNDPERASTMPFLVTATARTGTISAEEATAKGAVEKALELMGQGMSNALVTDLAGRSYKSTEFHLLLNERGKF
jgi:hypothetical protein